jgi:deazaflavin-dependent oxidoreductase (nitroreductase family)
MAYPQQGWHVAAFKAPITLCRLGLAPLIGHILMLITHTGRKSGQPRRTMVEFHKLDGRKYVAAAYGPRAQWVKNIQADPYVTIQTADGIERMKVTRVTDDEELMAVCQRFMQRDPPLTAWYLKSNDIRPGDMDDLLAKKERVYWLRFDPTEAATPPPLPTDLVWVWPVALVGLVALWLLRRER